MPAEPPDPSTALRDRFVRAFLDWVMLSILARKPSYGYEMIAIINEEYGVYVSPGSLYPILYNLERSGLVSGAWDHPDRKSKKVYKLTETGEREFGEGAESLARVLSAIRRKARTDSGDPPTA